MTAPAIGAHVKYTLTQWNADEINRRRVDYDNFRRTNESGGMPRNTGHIGHTGNAAAEDQVYPAIVVRVFDPSVSTANLQVLLDGNDVYWATSATEGEGPGHWTHHHG